MFSKMLRGKMAMRNLRKMSTESTNGLGKHLNYINIIVDIKLHKMMHNEIMKKIKKDGKDNR